MVKKLLKIIFIILLASSLLGCTNIFFKTYIEKVSYKTYVYKKRICFKEPGKINIIVLPFINQFDIKSDITEKLTDEFINYLNKNGYFNIVPLGTVENSLIISKSLKFYSLSYNYICEIFKPYSIRFILFGRIIYDPNHGSFVLDLEVLDRDKKNIIFKELIILKSMNRNISIYKDEIQNILDKVSKDLRNYFMEIKKC